MSVNQQPLRMQVRMRIRFWRGSWFFVVFIWWFFISMAEWWAFAHIFTFIISIVSLAPESSLAYWPFVFRHIAIRQSCSTQLDKISNSVTLSLWDLFFSGTIQASFIGKNVTNIGRKFLFLFLNETFGRTSFFALLCICVLFKQFVNVLSSRASSNFGSFQNQA